jgi:hypothetical protein
MRGGLNRTRLRRLVRPHRSSDLRLKLADIPALPAQTPAPSGGKADSPMRVKEGRQVAQRQSRGGLGSPRLFSGGLTSTRRKEEP